MPERQRGKSLHTKGKGVSNPGTQSGCVATSLLGGSQDLLLSGRRVGWVGCGELFFGRGDEWAQSVDRHAQRPPGESVNESGVDADDFAFGVEDGTSAAAMS